MVQAYSLQVLRLEFHTWSVLRQWRMTHAFPYSGFPNKSPQKPESLVSAWRRLSLSKSFLLKVTQSNMEFIRKVSETRSNKYHYQGGFRVTVKRTQTHQRRRETVEMAFTPNAFNKSAMLSLDSDQNLNYAFWVRGKVKEAEETSAKAFTFICEPTILFRAKI